MRSYGQYRPIARTFELFAERWTPILVRNLATGCRTFSQLRDGAPGIPKALLAERLTLLERFGVITDAETLASWNLRRLSFADAVHEGRIDVEGPPALVRAFPTWFRASPFAAVARAVARDAQRA